MVCPELGDGMETHELPPSTEALKASDPFPPLLVMAMLCCTIPGACVRAAKCKSEGATVICGGAPVTFSVTETSVGSPLTSSTRIRPRLLPACNVP